MQELVVEHLEQDTDEMAAENDANKICHCDRVVDWLNIGQATKNNTDNVFCEENDVTNGLPEEAFLFLFTKRFLMVQGNMDKVVDKNICQTIHQAHVKEPPNKEDANRFVL